MSRRGVTVRGAFLAGAAVVSILAVARLRCAPPPVPACASVTRTPTAGPASGSLTLCVLPSECREDAMSSAIAGAYCADKGGECAPATGCKAACVGTVAASALVASACTWDRNSECTTAAGDKGGKCACDRTIAAGAALACGCACAP